MDQIVFQTDLGYVALAERDHVLLALVFGHSTERSASRKPALGRPVRYNVRHGRPSGSHRRGDRQRDRL